MTETDKQTGKEEEGWKLHFEVLKHVTTLCTGSVLILIAFIEKIFTAPRWKFLVVVSLISFLLSIIFSVLTMVYIASSVRDVTAVGYWRREMGMRITSWLGTVGYICFLLGLCALVLFTMKNF